MSITCYNCSGKRILFYYSWQKYQGQITQWLGNLWVKSLNWLNYFYFMNESFSRGTQFQTLWIRWFPGSTPHLRDDLASSCFPPLCSTVNSFLQQQKQSPPFPRQVNPAPRANLQLLDYGAAWLPLTALPWGAFPTSAQLTSFSSCSELLIQLQVLCSSTPHSSQPQRDFPGSFKAPMCDCSPFSGLPSIETPFPSPLLLKH